MRLFWISSYTFASVLTWMSALTEKSEAWAFVLCVFGVVWSLLASLEWRHYWNEKEKEEVQS
jgi:hypothetical protein